MREIIKVNNIKEVSNAKDGKSFRAWRIYADNSLVNLSERCTNYKLLGQVAKGDEILVEYYTVEKNGSVYKNAKSIQLLDNLSDMEVLRIQLDITNEKLDALLQRTRTNKIADKIEDITRKFEAKADKELFDINL